MKTYNVKHEQNSQLVELPVEAHFPLRVTKVIVRENGVDRILSPAANSWDSFFHHGPAATDDFMAE